MKFLKKMLRKNRSLENKEQIKKRNILKYKIEGLNKKKPIQKGKKIIKIN